WASRLPRKVSICLYPPASLRGAHSATKQSPPRTQEQAKRDCFASLAMTRSRSLQPQPHHAHEAVRHLPVAVDAGVEADQHAAVIEIDDRILLQDDLGQLLVDRLAGGEIRDRAGLVEILVDVGVADAAVRLRSVADLEHIGVAVRIGAAAPGEQEG